MSFPRYPEYKDSGVAWLGNIPSAWKIKRVRFLFEIKKRIAESDDMDVLSITQNGIKVKDVESNDGQISSDYTKYQIVDVGDFAMNHMDLLTGYIDISKFAGVTSPDYRVFSVRDKNKCHDRYFLYLFQNGYRRKIFYAFGQGSSQFGRWRFPTDQFNDFSFPLPPLDEQIAIVEFLDRETAKIDALVMEQERLIELLKEKRQAVISHAVTKGLNLDAPMKDTGIEWLGQVPEHWQITRMKHVSSHVVDCLHTTPTYDGDVEFPAVRTADIDRGRLFLNQIRLVSREIYEERIQRLKPIAGDILYSREGERFGMAAIVPRDTKLCLGQRMMMFRLKVGMKSSYFMWVLNSDSVYQQVVAGTGGSTAPHVNISDVINFHVPHPPLVEQERIADHIEQSANAIDTLITEAQRAIDLLNERRAAVISAAVTGQIDVRGLVASNNAPAERVPA